MSSTTNLQVNDIVIQALKFIRVANEFSNISGNDLEQGVEILLEIIQEMNAASNRLPFYYSFEFDLVANQKDYKIGTGTEADVVRNYLNNITYINIFYAQVKYPVQIIQDFDALSQCVQTDITFLPGYARWYLENDSSGNTYTVISFLYAPNQTYTCQVRGKPTLDNITINGTIYDLPLYYRAYLRYELGKRLIPFYGRDDVWTASVQQSYEEVKRLIKGTVEIDLRVNTGGALLRYVNPYYYLITNQTT